MTPIDLYWAFKLDTIKGVLLFVNLVFGFISYTLIYLTLTNPKLTDTISKYKRMVALSLGAFAVFAVSVTAQIVLPSSAQYTATKLVKCGIMSNCSIEDAAAILKLIEIHTTKHLEIEKKQ